MNKANYQKELEKILQDIEQVGRKWNPAGDCDAPALYLHSCCAPCSSYVLEYLSGYFQITVFYYNPNISEAEEYNKRAREQMRLVMDLNAEGGRYPIQVVEGDYEPRQFYDMAEGLENCPEGGARCFGCYELRLRETARKAAVAGADYFCTTLSISPLKNAEKINEIGSRLAQEYGTAWLPSDFKKKEGYKRSVELSAKHGLYRQDYCGCEFSKIRK